jgi:xanthine dehydrogenase accessory factor
MLARSGTLTLMSNPAEDPACEVAHGTAIPAAAGQKVLIAVFATPVAQYLLRYAADAGYHTVLVEPDKDRRQTVSVPDAVLSDSVLSDSVLSDSVRADSVLAGGVTMGAADVVVTDHHRDELGVALRDALAGGARWVGIMGNPHHAGPHLEALTELGVSAAEIDRVHRPIGLNIGSRTPAEIAIATIAGLIADRNARPGGFSF